MTEINRAGEPGSLGEINTKQREFRQQIDALNDIVRQIGGNPDVNPGDAFPSDPLSAPYVLYVDPYTGKDTFVKGDYNTKDNGTFEDKVRRISLQRLECGYTINRPFRTINRAIIEAAIITSRDYLTLKPGVCGDLVSIVVAAGVNEVINGSGEEVADIREWQDGQVPTNEELQAFNPRASGGLILPRGCSVISLDLRKTILRPDFVPEPGPELSDFSNRRAIFKVTGGGYYFGFTFLDKLGFNKSHHLLDAFQYASKAELDVFYAKILQCFGPNATGLTSVENTQSRLSEYQITGELGPQPTSFMDASGGTDTVRSASPYIYNTSLRSTYGMCGIFADGDKVEGFKSMVVAQFTGVSLQNDYERWQKYVSGAWTQVLSFNDYVGVSPDSLRQDPKQRSFHVRAVNTALIQEVSVFAIGQGIHHLAESGAQLTITNSNSNFGGCSALAKGFQKDAASTDGPWEVRFFRTALNPLSKRGNINRIALGTLQPGLSDSTRTLEFSSDLAESTTVSGQPDILARDGYSLKENDYIWVDNPGGPDYRARLAANPWNPGTPNQIRIKEALTTERNDVPGQEQLSNVFPSIGGLRVFVRRLVDTRSVEERRYSLLLKNPDPSQKLRLPVRDYVIQETNSGNTALVQAVAASEMLMNDPNSDAKVELRYSNKPDSERDYNDATFYRKGDVVLRNNKHYSAIRDTTGPFKIEDFDESYVHMEDRFIPEGFFGNAQPTLTFDNDRDPSEESTDLGNTIADVEGQINTAVDYLGLRYFIRNLGFNSTTILALADTEDERNKEAINFSPPPQASPEVEFRRPTNCRLFGQAYEWTGYGNYSKALPQYQGDLSPSNKFTYYFTNQDGGKVFATGFNEEGLQVTPRGLEDITTGEVLSVTDIGNPDREITIPTMFMDLEVSRSLDLSFIPDGKITGPAKVAPISGDRNTYGPVRLARAATTNSQVIAGDDDSINQNAVDDGVVTPAWLNKWRIDNNLLSAPDASVDVFVDPVNGMDMSITELSSNPPNQPSRAVKSLRTAVTYANTVFGPEASVNFNLGAGPYLETGDRQGRIVFRTRATIRAFDFSANPVVRLNDRSDGGTKPFLLDRVFGPDETVTANYQLFTDPFRQPTFLSGATVILRNNEDTTQLVVSPLKLVFLESASITGCAWYGPAQTARAWAQGNLQQGADSTAADNYFKDVYTRQFSSNAERDAFVSQLKALLINATRNDDQQALSVIIGKCLSTDPASPGIPELIGQNNELNRIGAATVATFFKDADLRNNAVGAMIPVPGSEVAPQSRGVFETRGESLRLGGLYLIGNVKIEDGFGFTFGDRGEFLLRGFHESVVFTDERNRPNDQINVRFGGTTPRGANYNLPWNNISLVNNNLTKATPDSPDTELRDSAFQSRGPVIPSFINTPGTLALPAGIWTRANRTKDTERQGFDGAFGRCRNTAGVKNGNEPDAFNNGKTRGLFGYRNNFDGDLLFAPPKGGFRVVRSSGAPATFWNRAGAVNTLDSLAPLPEEISATPGKVIPPNEAGFDNDPTVIALNISVSLYNKGTDPETGTSSSDNVKV